MAPVLVRIATREAPLAMAQSEMIKAQLQKLAPQRLFKLLPMKTTGDKFLNQPLSQIGGKGLFVKELEHALLSGEADLAVHSMKDMPAILPDGLVLGAIAARGPVHDVFISPAGLTLENIKNRAVIGTSSLRRACQLKRYRPDIEIKPLRGNINTRINKLEQGEYDAIVLAYAGIQRLGLTPSITKHFDPLEFIPAIGQGVLGIECRGDDVAMQTLLQPIIDEPTRLCLMAERALSAQLGGNCHLPLAGYATIDASQKLTLRALLADPETNTFLHATAMVDIHHPEQAGEKCAHDLLAQGGNEILRKFYS